MPYAVRPGDLLDNQVGAVDWGPRLSHVSFTPNSTRDAEPLPDCSCGGSSELWRSSPTAQGLPSELGRSPRLSMIRTVFGPQAKQFGHLCHCQHDDLLVWHESLQMMTILAGIIGCWTARP
jgi:hypothetical protein